MPTPIHVPTHHARTHTPLPGLVPCPQLWLILPGAMTFSTLMDSVVSKGPFQFIVMTLLGLPILGMANHNLLQIFTAITPSYHCRPPPNASAGPWVLPMGRNGKPERCLRFVYPPNASLPNDTHRATEPCLDGWVYNISARSSIVTEVCPEATPLPHLHPAAVMDRRTGWGSGSLGPGEGVPGRQRARTWVQMQPSHKVRFL